MTIKFNYNVFDHNWKEFTGVLEAADENAAVEHMGNDGFYVIRIEQINIDTPVCHIAVAGPADEEVLAMVEEEQPERQWELPRVRELPLYRRAHPWLPIAAIVAAALAILAVAYSIASNNRRAQKEAISALHAQIASLANPSTPPASTPPSTNPAPSAAPAVGTVPPPPGTQPQQPLLPANVVPGPGLGSTGSYTAGPYGVVVDNRFNISVNGGAVTVATNKASTAGKSKGTAPNDQTVLAVGDDVVTLAPGTRYQYFVIKAGDTNLTQIARTPVGASECGIYPRKNVLVRPMHSDGTWGAPYVDGPMVNNTPFWSPPRALRFQWIDDGTTNNTVVLVTYRGGNPVDSRN